MTDEVNTQLFARVCELEAKLELANARLYEVERLLTKALFIAEHSDWKSRDPKQP